MNIEYLVFNEVEVKETEVNILCFCHYLWAMQKFENKPKLSFILISVQLY